MNYATMIVKNDCLAIDAEIDIMSEEGIEQFINDFMGGKEESKHINYKLKEVKNAMERSVKYDKQQVIRINDDWTFIIMAGV